MKYHCILHERVFVMLTVMIDGLVRDSPCGPNNLLNVLTTAEEGVMVGYPLTGFTPSNLKLLTGTMLYVCCGSLCCLVWCQFLCHVYLDFVRFT